MIPHKLEKAALGELASLLRQGIITLEQYDTLSLRYPETEWDFHFLGRWFLFFGAISFAIGIVILFQQYCGFNLQTGTAFLGLGFVGGIYCALLLKKEGLIFSARSVELLSGFSLIGLSYTVALMYSTGGDNWPAPLLLDIFLLLALSYLLLNPLVLVLTIIVLFTWFGGETGYLSGWGAYYFGMNYPLRFLAAAMCMNGLALVHMKSEDGPLKNYRGFSKVWLSSGIYLSEMSIWILSIFGNFGSMSNYSYESSLKELFFYNLLWFGSNIFLVWIGATRAMRMLIGYGVTFLIIQLYTIFFQYFSSALGPLATTLFAGFGALALTFYLEKKRNLLFPQS